MKTELERYLGSLIDFRENSRNNRWLVMHFAYFLTEIVGDSVTVANLRECYEAASLRAPGNISDVVSKSKAFVKTKQGLSLHRDARASIASELSATNSENLGMIQESSTVEKARNVVVVYGRDESVRLGLFQFLRAIKLNPIEWGEAVRETGHGSPYVGQIVESLFTLAQVVVVLFTPDENARLKDALKSSEDDEALNQPRPNVLIESGMALARDETHTIIVQVGRIRAISDLSGRHVIRLNNTAQKRLELAQRLQSAGCAVSTTGADWLTVGDFTPA